MEKFYDLVGYGPYTEEVSPDVFTEVIKSRKYYGDILRNTRRLETGSEINSSIVINNSVSIVADAYAFEHFFAIRFVRWNKAFWTVTNVEVNRPRLILTLGGIYNGKTS